MVGGIAERETTMTLFAVAGRTTYAIMVAGALAAASAVSAPVQAGDEFHYDETNIDAAAYFAALSNLAYAVMFSGLGEALVISPYERDEWLRRAGFVTRPAMPDMAAVGPVNASAQPRFAGAPDFAAPRTLAWDQSSFDRTLDPAAQAWAMVKIASPEFHLQYHELPDNRLAGLMMIPQAHAQAQTLEKRLEGEDGLFASVGPDGRFGAPRPRNQIAVLWAASNMILAGNSERDDYWHTAWRDLTDADSYRALAGEAFAAVEMLPPLTPAERGLAIEALRRFALATDDAALRGKALTLARSHSDCLPTISARASRTGQAAPSEARAKRGTAVRSMKWRACRVQVRTRRVRKAKSRPSLCEAPTGAKRLWQKARQREVRKWRAMRDSDEYYS